MPEDSDKKKLKLLRIIEIYDMIISKTSEAYAPYLAKSYYIENTIHECCHAGIKDVSRCVVYEALRKRKKLEKEKPFLL